MILCIHIAHIHTYTAKDGALPLVHPVEAKKEDPRVMRRCSSLLYWIPTGSIEILQVAQGLEVERVSCAPDDAAIKKKVKKESKEIAS